MTDKSKVIYLSAPGHEDPDFLRSLRESCKVVEAASPMEALEQLADGGFTGFYIGSDFFPDATRLAQHARNEQVLAGMPDGIAMIDLENKIHWANKQFIKWSSMEDVVGADFYRALGTPEILGPDFCPFHSALATSKPSVSILRPNEAFYLQVHASPVLDKVGMPRNLIVTVRDVTTETMQQQKLEAIHKAGTELANLTPEEVFSMEVEDRVDLLKSNILHFTNDLLDFDVIEVRLIDQQSKALIPLLSVGLNEEAENRPLYAMPQENGVSGFVASTGKSYLCEDTTEDPLYISGAKNAKSSLTVPLILQDTVIGTFNVESPQPRAFGESDRQFLEIFSRDLALALNTLELLVAQQANTAQESIEAIHSAVAVPVDDILNDAVNVMEHYAGEDTEVEQRLRAILAKARDIKKVIQQVGRSMTQGHATPVSLHLDENRKLQSRRVLVVCIDADVRSDANAYLSPHGCFVEAAYSGAEALAMVRSSEPDNSYDAIISDIYLPDCGGYELYVRLQEILDFAPLVLMAGFGWDANHNIRNSRAIGLLPFATVYKPLRVEQLIEVVEKMADECDSRKVASG